ncbi:hypothetical protein [Terribacillus sp. AE2B 122]|nr:hypothetical protein [Terribacillus sp. AE2B 122]
MKKKQVILRSRVKQNTFQLTVRILVSSFLELPSLPAHFKWK